MQAHPVNSAAIEVQRRGRLDDDSYEELKIRATGEGIWKSQDTRCCQKMTHCFKITKAARVFRTGGPGRQGKKELRAPLKQRKAEGARGKEASRSRGLRG